MEKGGQRPNEYFIYAQLLAYATAKPKEPARAERCIRNAVEDWGPGVGCGEGGRLKEPEVVWTLLSWGAKKA